MGELVVLFLVIASGLSVISWSAERELRATERRRASELDRPHTRADAAREHEEVKVVAVIDGRSTVTSPVERRSCVAWRVEIEHDGDHGWACIVDRTYVGTLDATEGALAIHLREGSAVVVTWPEPPAWTESCPREIESLLLEARVRAARVRWRERRLQPGEVVAILGAARWRTTDAGDYRGAARELELGERGRLPLRISARPEHMR